MSEKRAFELAATGNVDLSPSTSRRGGAFHCQLFIGVIGHRVRPLGHSRSIDVSGGSHPGTQEYRDSSPLRFGLLRPSVLGNHRIDPVSRRGN